MKNSFLLLLTIKKEEQECEVLRQKSVLVVIGFNWMYSPSMGAAFFLAPTKLFLPKHYEKTLEYIRKSLIKHYIAVNLCHG